MLDVRSLSMVFGKKSLFQDVDLILLPSQRYGVVGANGTGKSTFLKILAGEESPSQGSVEKAKSLNVGILKQDHFRYEEDKLIDVVIQGNTLLWDALTEKINCMLKKSSLKKMVFALANWKKLLCIIMAMMRSIRQKICY